MGRFIEGYDRSQPLLLPACVDDYVPQESLVRVVDAFVETLDLTALGFVNVYQIDRDFYFSRPDAGSWRS